MVIVIQLVLQHCCVTSCMFFVARFSAPYVYQALDGCFIEVTTMGELSLGWQKGGSRHLIEVAG